MAQHSPIRSRLEDLVAEIRARRAGKLHSSPQSQAIRHIVGPTGYLAQNTLGPAAKGAAAFNQSFAPRVPPSLHISHADARRQGTIVPLAERCIEDWQTRITYADPHQQMGDDLS
ncbi:MAG: hypothetical protein P8L46_01325 [Acidimicrobiales bacterium]|nr:hypothetical protein [Acidimicrobiales bacterium]MDG2216666.1 hypothetical protein [Acidimicrobiales bacterium]